MRRILLASCATAALSFTPVAHADAAAAAGKPLAIALTQGITVTEGQHAHPVLSASGGNGRAVTVAWKTSDGRSGSVSLSVSRPVTLDIGTTDDTVVNGTRSLGLSAQVVSGSVHPSAQTVIAILDNDVAPVLPVISANAAAVNEDAGSVTAHISRSGDLSGQTCFVWATEDATAIRGINYVASSGGRCFGVGQSDLSATVPVLRDGKYQPDLVFNLVLKEITGGTLGKNAPVTIRNVDPAPPPPQPTTKTCAEGSTVPADQDCPTQTPPVTTTPPPTDPTASPGLSGVAPIVSNFDVAAEIQDAPVPGTAAPDTLGAFRFICNAGQVLADDPIVYPGQPGKSHLHQFYGNTGANAYSTYESLRTTGDSTCMSPVNRSGYWMPAMLDGRGNVVRPDYVTIYYKRYPATSWQCTDGRATKGCVPLPNGLRYIMGRDMLNLSAPPTGNFHFLCDNNTGNWPTLQQALKVCEPGHHIDAVVDAPPCWNGTQLDSADHRSHMAYMVDSHMGYVKCPDTHPYMIPQFTLGANYLVVAGEDTSGWKFSSDDMAPNEPAGSTFHADWFGAWDNTVMAMWTDNCINKLLNCSAGILGNGKIIRMYSGFSWSAVPRLLPLSQVPQTPVR
jgi:hypothetical protein